MLKGVLSIFGGNLLGKVIGVAREILLSYFYGTGVISGAQKTAQTSAFITVNFFTSDILNSGFIPLYKRLELQGEGKEDELFWSLNTILLVASLLICFFVNVFSLDLVTFIAPGATEELHLVASEFLSVFAYSIPFYVLGALYANLAVAKGHYRLISSRPTVQSCGLIGGLFLSYYFDEYLYIAYGFTVAYILHFIYSTLFLYQKSLVNFTSIINVFVLGRFWQLIKPLLPLPFFLQGNLIIEKAVASFLGIEVISAIEYAKFITETGMVLLAIPIGYVGLSTISGLCKDGTITTLKKTMPFVFLLTIPASSFLMTYSHDVISIIFERGAFDEQSVALTASILIGLSIGFWAQVASYILMKAMNANMKNKTVLVFMFIALLANSILNISMYNFLGPMTLGVGVSVYGILLLAFTMGYYKLYGSMLIYILPLLLFGLVFFFLEKEVMQGISLAFSFLMFFIYWLLVICCIPAYRMPFLQILQKVFKV